MSKEQQPDSDNKPTSTGLDWELQQALIHLKNAMSLTDSQRGHLLCAAIQVVKGVKD